MIVHRQLAAGDLVETLGDILAKHLTRGALARGVAADQLDGLKVGVGIAVGGSGGRGAFRSGRTAAGGKAKRHDQYKDGRKELFHGTLSSM